MIDNHFRALLPRHVAPLVKLLNGLGLSPNQITVLGLLVALVSVYLVTQKMFIGAFVVWWLSRLLDALDGIYARTYKRTSHFGAFLDIQLDMLAYSAMVLAFAWVYPEHSRQWLLMLFCYVLCISGALGLGAFENQHGIADHSGRSLRIAVGLAEGGETGIAYSVFLLAPAWLPITTWVWIGVLIITIVARLLLAHAELGSRES
ncbi:MAG: CDP-alcohol phosphatidyltransferase family protein [Gammaproteobacteria bacterium]|nr:CDP-alcohol phosphatidyltransferase family protein [Gammaproteobacteria bacterium]